MNEWVNSPGELWRFEPKEWKKRIKGGNRGREKRKEKLNYMTKYQLRGGRKTGIYDVEEWNKAENEEKKIEVSK